MLTRVKTFVATGVAPNGRLYAGDLNAIQDAVAAQSDFAQTVGVGTLQIGETGLALNRFGAGEARITGAFRVDGTFKAGSWLYANLATANQVVIGYNGVSAGGMSFGSATDTNLYRQAAGDLRTDGTLRAGATTSMISIGGVAGGTPTIYFGNAFDTALYRGAAGTLTTGGLFQVGQYISANSSNANQVLVGYSGGAAAPGITFGNLLDTYLYRETTSQLRTNSHLIVDLNIFSRGAIYFGSANDTNLYRAGADFLATDDTFAIGRPLANSFAFQTTVGAPGGVTAAFVLRAGGQLQWSDGIGGALDTSLYRGSANILRTDGNIQLFNLSTDGQPQISLVRNLGGASKPGIHFGPGGGSALDTALYRNAAGVLQTDTSLVIAGNLTVSGAITGGGVVPAGAMMEYGGAAAPTGWLLADGSAVSRTTYAALFTAIGTAYGVGDNSTTFNLPNMKGRCARGFDSGTVSVNALGKTGGAETHPLTVAELAVHAHTVNEGAGHTHTMNNPTHAHGTGGVASGGTNPNAPGAGGGVLGVSDTGTSIPVNLSISGAAANQTAVANTTGLTINNNGSGTAHNNLSPYVTVNYIIKT